MKKIAMIPARMGSQRLKKKNLRELDGVPLITHAIRKCLQSGCFDEIWVNSEDVEFEAIAKDEGVFFHQRPQELGNNQATSEQFVTEFLNHRDCDLIFQVHSIAPLLTVNDLQRFVNYCESSGKDCVLSCEEIQIECAYKEKPINFVYTEKTNSQELTPVQRVSWSVTCWKRSSFLKAAAAGQCATYSGEVGFFNISKLAAHVIKTEEDLQFAEAVLPLIEQGVLS